MSSFAASDTTTGGILLSAGSGMTVGPVQTYPAQNVTGYIYATVSGIGLVEQSFDGLNYDVVSSTVIVTSGVYTFNQPVLGCAAQVVYKNGGNGQTGLFKLYLKAQDTGLI